MLYYASPERESRNNVVFARERSDRGDPEDRSTSQNIPSFRAFGEESPKRVVYCGVNVIVISSPYVLPFRVYAHPLKRERWHA